MVHGCGNRLSEAALAIVKVEESVEFSILDYYK